MSAINITQQSPGIFSVAGDLTFVSIDKKTVESLAFLKSAPSVTIDLAQVTNTDSGGLALLIEWIKFARDNRIELKFRNIPEQLLTLAKLSGLETTEYFAAALPE
ncbi:STAS domain-containing protein [Methylotuvimicrobium sp. KM2]|uniref:STAS domain-containing protein n=1 Tax=Methylotuvimicrobium sp. KM2 TaxID=3133976 RepID=UPI003101B1D4